MTAPNLPPLPALPTYEEAAARQYRYSSFYTVFIVSPDGSRVFLGSIARKTGTGLRNLIGREYVQTYLAALPGMDGATFTKHADELRLSNGYKIVFGGTIRQEATR